MMPVPWPCCSAGPRPRSLVLRPSPTQEDAERRTWRICCTSLAATTFRWPPERRSLQRRSAGQIPTVACAAERGARRDVSDGKAWARQHWSADDLLNFQYDPVACAVALGWSGATVEDIRVRPLRMDDVLSFQPHPNGRSTRIVLDVDGAAFREMWLSAVEAAGHWSS
jgi:hypothetical protein